MMHGSMVSLTIDIAPPAVSKFHENLHTIKSRWRRQMRITM